MNYPEEPKPMLSDNDRGIMWHSLAVIGPGWLAAHLGLRAGEIIAIADELNLAGMGCVNAIAKRLHPPEPESLA